MSESVQVINLANLLIAFLPAVVVVLILFKWTMDGPESVYALARMLGQLLVIGYFLSFIFESGSSLVVLLVLVAMVFISSWIALRTVKDTRSSYYGLALTSICFGGGISLLITTQLVLKLEPFYLARYVIPLAGMIFANAMNSVSIAAERYQSDRRSGVVHDQARSTAFKAALIPITNSLFAVGLVSLPGMMTGQILSGVEPVIAARYQIMVMCMLFSSAGISAATFLLFIENRSDGPQN